MVREILLEKIQKVLAESFGLADFVPEIQQTKPDFEGDFTVVTFPLVKVLKKSPDIIATELGDKILSEVDFLENYNIFKAEGQEGMKNSDMMRICDAFLSLRN